MLRLASVFDTMKKLTEIAKFTMKIIKKIKQKKETFRKSTKKIRITVYCLIDILSI